LSTSQQQTISIFALDRLAGVFFFASFFGLQLLWLLWSVGADVNLSCDDGTMALHSACSAKKNSADILREEPF